MLTPNKAEWATQRFQTDGRMRVWADTLHAIDLVGDLTYFSGSTGAEVTKPIALCVAHFFNHQTHHRGQIHCLLSQAGLGQNVPSLDIHQISRVAGDA